MVTWRIHLNPWLYQKNNANSVLQCPSLEPPVQDDTTLRQGTRPASYGLNFSNGLHEYKDGGTNIEGARETDVVNPSGTILACDIAKITAVSNTPSDWVVSNSITNFGYARFPSNWSNDPWVIFPRHSGRANVLFYDGHTKSVDVLADIINAPRDNAACIYDNQ
ncbi:MAG: hypothetical protein LBK99_19040 [Opitutaceae bacterium]|nr:hypothetical protein [Opitutaceae bacterium]